MDDAGRDVGDSISGASVVLIKSASHFEELTGHDGAVC